MYVDTTGNVTIGIGKLISSAHAATQMPFVHRATGEPATDDEIRNEFFAISNQPAGRRASYYRKFTNLVLGDATIRSLARDHVDENRQQILQLFPNFDSFPDNVQVAIYDMVYNLGIGGLRRKFPKFVAAIRRGDWNAAADESSRSQVSEDRNQRTEDRLRNPNGLPQAQSDRIRPRIRPDVNPTLRPRPRPWGN